MTKTPCAGQTFEYIGNRWHACTAPGKFEHDGKHYCGIHHPPNVAQRKAVSLAKYDKGVKLIAANYSESILAAAALAWMKLNMPEKVKELESRS